MNKNGIDAASAATGVSETSSPPNSGAPYALSPEAAQAARDALRAGVLGDYAREVDVLRDWHQTPESTAFGRARLAELQRFVGGAR